MEEKEIERRLINRLVEKNGYSLINIKSLKDIRDNFLKHVASLEANKKEIYKLTKGQRDHLLPAEEEDLILKLESLSSYKAAKLFHDGQVELKRNHEELPFVLTIFDKKNYSNNKFEVSNQVKDADIDNDGLRYDVTLFVNGLPVIQIELKNLDVDRQEEVAFDQIVRYKESGGYRGLFNFLELFVVSTGLFTKYFANNDSLSYKFAFRFTDEENNWINGLLPEFTSLTDDYKPCFADTFLNSNFVFEMLTKYIVIKEEKESCILAMRPYQIFASKALFKDAMGEKKGGFIFHSMASGKTLTSFNFSKLLAKEDSVKKVFFVVDRDDLNAKSIDDFMSYSGETSSELVDSANTRMLSRNIKEPSKKIIVTTIQKLHVLLKNKTNKAQYNEAIEVLGDGTGCFFIFDECHRTTNGDMALNLRRMCPKITRYGFTGTPIFPGEGNMVEDVTENVFGKPLHSYRMDEAQRDENVLQIKPIYSPTIEMNDEEDDETAQAINTRGAIQEPERILAVDRDIANSFNRLTMNGRFNAIVATSYVADAVRHYDNLRKLRPDLKVACIFSPTENEPNPNIKDFVYNIKELKRIVKEFNEQFGYNEQIDDEAEDRFALSKSYKSYDDKVATVFEHPDQCNVLVVVDKYLTGSDYPFCNTIYLDKKFGKTHQILQAINRTTRVCKDDNKTEGNCVLYLNTKAFLEKAIRDYCNPKNKNFDLFAPAYEELLKDFKEDVKQLLALNILDNLTNDEINIQFINTFSHALRSLNRMEKRVEHDFEKCGIDPEKWQMLYGIYKNLYNKYKHKLIKKNILDCVHFVVPSVKGEAFDYNHIVDLIKNAEKREAHERKAVQLKLLDEIPEINKKILVKKWLTRWGFIESEDSEPESITYYDEDLGSYQTILMSEVYEQVEMMTKKFDFKEFERLLKIYVDYINGENQDSDMVNLRVEITDYVGDESENMPLEKRLELGNPDNYISTELINKAVELYALR